MSKKICTICARGGSAGVKDKNIRLFLGKPLIAHTVEQAIKSGLFDEIAIGSDSPKILEAGIAAGATRAVRRPDLLATDSAKKSPAIVHCAQEVERITGKQFDIFVDLDVTAPLRTPDHIREAVSIVESGRAANIFSACPSRRSPYFNLVETKPNGRPGVCIELDPRPVRRQDVPATFDMNASIYIWNRESFYRSQAAVFDKATLVYEMPEFTVFDIDSEFDFELVEYLFKQKILGKNEKH